MSGENGKGNRKVRRFLPTLGYFLLASAEPVGVDALRPDGAFGTWARFAYGSDDLFLIDDRELRLPWEGRLDGSYAQSEKGLSMLSAFAGLSCFF